MKQQELISSVNTVKDPGVFKWQSLQMGALPSINQLKISGELLHSELTLQERQTLRSAVTRYLCFYKTFRITCWAAMQSLKSVNHRTA
ncbi:hypothetical protein AVEN_17186-1 [Araneus ventricosus]|uniref:Uncharacterized protein n=1 Tax=Araneus ventricosus TaxID=182803 RepID=A0A4Y2DTR0_ARAVE|nr:hypothetical protein AVEN_17186-1 [Araneus ventricosus]